MRGGGTPCSLEGDPGDFPRFFSKSMSLRMHFKPFLKPFFPYSITSILNKVRHSNPGGGGGGVL